MWTSRILAVAIVLTALTIPTSQFAQDSVEEHASLVGLVRTINTWEVTDLSQYGSYASWPMLLERHGKDLDGWAARFFPRREANTHVGPMPEILPGWNLRLSVQPDGQGYVLVIEDANDKAGYAALTDERGIIRECKYLQ